MGFATLFALMAGHAILETARDTLFLATLPASMLPWSYLAMAVLALISASISQRHTRFSRRRVLSISLLIGAGVNVAFFVLSSLARSASSLLIFYVWTGLFATVVVVQFWILLGDVLDLSQAKRVFAWIGAGGLLGATAGSGLAGGVVDWFRPQVLLVVASGLFVLAAMLPGLFTHRRELRGNGKRARLRQRVSAGASLLRHDAYLRRLLGFVLLATLLVTGVDYVFKAVVAESIAGPRLGVFFSRYYAAINGIALLVQILVAPRVLRSAGVNRSLLIMPALLLAASVGFAFSAGMVAAVLLRGVDGSLRHSINRTASEILYLPLEPEIRGRFKTLIEAIGQRGGQALASVAILAAIAAGATPRQMAWALVGLSAAWLVCIVGLRPHYLELFRTRLRQGTIETRVDVAELDLHTLEALVSALSSDDDSEVIAALEMFATYGKLNLVPALILFHPSREVVLRAFALFANSARKDIVRLSARLLRHTDHEIRAAALRHFSAREPSEGPLRRCLEDDSPACRATAAVGLISAGLVGSVEAERMLRAIIDGPFPDARQALALSLAQLAAREYGWVALELAKVKQVGLPPLIARSLALSPSNEHIPALVLLLAQRDGRHEAREALKRLGNRGLDYLERALGDLAVPRSVRRHLPRTISYFATARAADILVRRLACEDDEAVEYKILRGLGRMREDEPELHVDRDALLEHTQELLRYAITLLAWRLVVDTGRASSARYDTPAGDLLGALLADLESGAVERVFRLLHILRPSEEFAMIYDGLRSNEPAVRAGSLELLEHVIPKTVRDGLLAMVDDAPPAQRLRDASAFFEPALRPSLVEVPARADAEAPEQAASTLGSIDTSYALALAEMLESRSAVLRSVAGYHAAELGIEALRHKLPRSELEPRSSSGLAERALRALSPPRMELERA